MLIIKADRAPLIYQWIKDRGGVAVWNSISLSDPSKQLLTPALTDGKPTTKPHWSVTDTPEVISDAAAVWVTIDKEVKRFHIALRNTGLYIKLTDASSRRVRAETERAGEDAHYEFDYDCQEAVIFKSTQKFTLTQYAVEKGL